MAGVNDLSPGGAARMDVGAIEGLAADRGAGSRFIGELRDPEQANKGPAINPRPPTAHTRNPPAATQTPITKAASLFAMSPMPTIRITRIKIV
jgi:hypothetical protein